MSFSEERESAELKRLMEVLRQAGVVEKCSNFTFVYVASGGQHVGHVENQYFGAYPQPLPEGRGAESGKLPEAKQAATHRIRQSIELLMLEKYGDEPLFNLQGHWQAVYRILVDKGYCRDSDFDGFDTFIRTVMPEEVNKPYSKGSLKQISQTDFSRPFLEWKFDPETSKTRKPFDRMVAVAERFKELLEEKGL